MDKNDIMPFHLFRHLERHYIINIEKMLASSIDDATAKYLKVIATHPQTAIPPGIEQTLQELELINEDKGKKNENISREAVPVSTVAIFLTNSCNLKCIYCYEDGVEHKAVGDEQEDTALQTVDWLIEQSAQVKKLNIIFFGGEPFLNYPLMKKIVEYSQQKVREAGKRIGFSVTTNATLLDDEKIAFLKKHNVRVTISIDGPREIHDMQRPFPDGKGSYDLILPKIKKLLAVLPETRGHAVVGDSSKSLMVKEALREIGFKNVTDTMMSSSLSKEKPVKIKPAEEVDRLFKMMELEAEEWLKLVKNKDYKALANLRSGNLYEGIFFLLHNIKAHFPCQGGTTYAAVSCSGDVYPCQRFVGLDKYKLGNVFSEENVKREQYNIPPRKFVKKCAACFAKYYCAGGCKYTNAASSGSIFKPSGYYCRVKRHELELSAYIYCNLGQQEEALLIENKIFPPKLCPLDFS